MFFSWDADLPSSTPGFELNASGITDLANPKECRDGSCVMIPTGGFLQLAPHNWGQYPGLTFAFWYKADAQSGSDARIIDFGRGADQDNIIIARQGTTRNLVFSVRVNAQSKLSTCVSVGSWRTNQWRHVLWALAPTTVMPPYLDSVWEIYVDGEWSITSSGAYPVDADLTLNYLGRSNSAVGNTYIGHVDSFSIFQFAAKENQITQLMNVSKSDSSKSV